LYDAFENCRLSRGREQEIRAELDAQMAQENGDGEDFAAEGLLRVCENYSVQEMIFALTHVRDVVNRAQEEEKSIGNRASDALYPAMIAKLRALDKVYLTIDKNTNYPFLNNGFVDVYTEEAYAQMAVLFYKEQFRELEVKAMPVSNPEMLKPEEGQPLAAQMPAFVLFYYLGMERVLVDDGLYRAALGRGDVLPPPDFSKRPAAAVPVTNPALRLRILDFFGEARWKVNYEKRGEVLQAKEHAMLTEVAKAKFIIPMKYEGAAQPKPGTNQIVFNKDTKLMFAALKNTAGETYTPIFTDFAELGKMYQPKDWGAAVISIQDAISINKGDGIAINPLGENLVLKEKAIGVVGEILKKLKEQAENV
ncbi:MAG: SseB family protein, partial [Lachnospiraceae bacterium]|nr:SseB family protein [Lachnospiraceae bacterium]